MAKEIDDLEFLMECRYKYEDYPSKDYNTLTTNIEEEHYMTNEEKEYQDLLKQLEEINLDELLMNIASRASNVPRNNNQNSSLNNPSTSNLC